MTDERSDADWTSPVPGRGGPFHAFDFKIKRYLD